MPVKPGVESPRVRALREELEQGQAGVLEAFWREVAERGTPLVEPDADRDEAYLVTFVWRETEPLENVVLAEWWSLADFVDKQLTKLPGTDLWFRTDRMRSDLRTVYRFAPNDSLVSKHFETDLVARWMSWLRDPLNPNYQVVFPRESEEETLRHAESILELPDAAPLPWYGARPGTPAGTVEQHRFASEILGNERDVWVYTPPRDEGRGTRDENEEVRRPRGYPGGEAARSERTRPSDFGLLVLFDGEMCQSALEAPVLLDNLIGAGAIPPLVAVMVGNVDRNLELPCHAPFARFLADELVPWARERYPVSHDAARTIVAGQSYGGLAAVYAAFERPDVFGNALSQSGSFWWKPDPFDQESEPLMGEVPEYAWLNARIAERPPVPVRLWLEAGYLENNLGRGAAPSLLVSNRHLRDILVAKGYDFTYREYAGGHDYVWWRGTLADGLTALTETEPFAVSR